MTEVHGGASVGGGFGRGKNHLAYRSYQRELLGSEIPRVALALLAITLLFVVFLLFFDWPRVRSSWGWVVLLVLTPAGTLLAARLGLARRWPYLVALGTDAAYTGGIVAGLAAPATPTSGTALFISVKMLASAMLLPWHPAAQVASATGTLVLYWVVGWLGARFVWPSADFAHQVTGPFFAALVSVIAGLRMEHLRRRLFQETQLAQERAEANARFAAILSHELRNLLGAVLGYGELVRDALSSPADFPKAREAADRQVALAHQALETIQVALDLSREETVRSGTNQPLDELWEELRQEYALRPVPAGVRLRWDVSPDLPKVPVDGTKLKLVIRNLVDNALKFTPAGEVRVRVRAGFDELVFEVSDTGIGIPPEKQPFIFDPFRRAAPEDFPQGVGLGLYVSSRLVEAMGGAIQVQSAVGRGTSFEVRIPLRVPRQREEGSSE
ncbi:MAG: hypothetical protein KatS3mg077_2274 [Candidatus Binatia bacterium]|nr:MAG: hypothetical protein KatS3mg077_2274 [Candidatus Binatia bacterium]